MAKNIELVRQEVAAMRNEVEDFANSAERVGGVVSDVLEYGHEKLTDGKNKHEALAERVTVAEGAISAEVARAQAAEELINQQAEQNFKNFSEFGLEESAKMDGYEIALTKKTNTAEKTKVKVPVYDMQNPSDTPVGLVDEIFVDDMKAEAKKMADAEAERAQSAEGSIMAKALDNAGRITALETASATKAELSAEAERASNAEKNIATLVQQNAGKIKMLEDATTEITAAVEVEKARAEKAERANAEGLADEIVEREKVTTLAAENSKRIDEVEDRVEGNSYYIKKLYEESTQGATTDDGRELGYAITDEEGYIAWGLTKRGNVIENVPESTKKMVASVEKSLGERIDHRQPLDETRDDIFGVVDEKNNLGFLVDKEGNIHLESVVNGGKRLYVVDGKGNIGAMLDEKGKLHAMIEEVAKAVPEYQVPEKMYTVLNDCYSDTISNIKRNYVPKMRIERMTENRVLIGNGGTCIPLVQGFTNVPANVVSSLNISNRLCGKGFSDAVFSFTLESVKNSVLVDKDIRLLCLGDSLTDADLWTSYIGKLIHMDNIDHKKKYLLAEDKIKYYPIGIRSNGGGYCDFTYRDEKVDFTDYNEGRSSWAAATYLRHACLFTWATVTYKGVSKSILHVAWRVLGLYEKENTEYNGSEEQKDLIRYTCSGQYPLSANCIDGWVWMHFRGKCGYNNVAFENATDAQKLEVLGYLDGTADENILDNPENPFFSIAKVRETKNSGDCIGFDWLTYYNRYKTHGDDGRELSVKGSNYVGNSYVCNPNYVAINLGTNDGVFGSTDAAIRKTINDVYKIAELIKDATGARVMMFQNAYPIATMPELSLEQDLAVSVGNSNNSTYMTKNKIMMEVCGNIGNQREKGIWYCPSFFSQRQSCYDRPFQDVGSDKEIGYIVANGDVHPSAMGYADIGYAVYAMMCYLLSV